MNRTSLKSSGHPFDFTKENKIKAQKIIEKYPPGRHESAIMPLLDLAQRQNQGWISLEVVEFLGSLLNMPVIRIQEIASFYTMYALKPVGAYHIQLCRTTPCWLKGSDKIKEACLNHGTIKMDQTSEDSLFSLMEVECLGACTTAPVVQINDYYFENLTPDTMSMILDDIEKNPQVDIGVLHQKFHQESLKNKYLTREEKNIQGDQANIPKKDQRNIKKKILSQNSEDGEEI
jgi:NADH-quinone oxidoreductase E subunit